ncbi:MAG: hypothetical protein IJ658_07770 [Kiritimatiellae bacterium]|nr:hypothetical protein [Kiritimatiellia bacterium]
MFVKLATAMALSISVPAFSANVATCTWCGPSSGGNWTNAANWAIVRASGNESLSDEEVMKSYCAWNINALADGAVVTNTSTSLKIGSLDFSAANRGTVTFEDVANANFAIGPGATIDIHKNNTVECRLRQPGNWDTYNSDADKKVIFRQGGTFVFRPNGAYFTWLRDYQPCGASTVRLASGNINWSDSYVTPWDNGSVLAIDANVTVSRINGNQGINTLRLENGHSLLLGGGERSNGRIAPMLMPTRGTGDMLLAGGQDYNWTGALDYTGSFGLVDGLVNFNGGLAVPTSVEVRVNGGGTINFTAAQSLGVISGTGSTGTIRMPDDSTLTVSGTNAAAVSQFDARISGKTDFVKGGSDYDLTLTGDNAWTGTTRVAAGTLGIKRCNYRHGLVASWTFDDPANLGADSGPRGVPLTFFSGNETVPTQIVNGVDGRPALHLASPTTAKPDYQAFRVNASRLTAANGFSKRGGAMCVSFWMKPDMSKCTASSYVFRRGSWTTNKEFMLWLNASAKSFRLSIDDYAKTADELNIYAVADTIGDGNWHHVVASYEDKKLQLWYDGRLIGEQVTPSPLALESNTPTDNGLSLIFGNPYTDANHRFDSGIDDVCVWNHALTEEEVSREYSLRGGMASPADALPDPIAHWRFDDDSDIGKDEMGNTHLVLNDDMASPNALALASAYAPMGKALAASRSLKVEGGGYPKGLPLGEKPFSVSIRMLARSATEWGTVLFWGDNTPQHLFRLGYGNSPRRFHASYYNTGKGADLTSAYSDSNREADHCWVHFVVTLNPQSYMMKIFRDGVLEKTHTSAWVNMPEEGNFYINWRPGQSGASASLIDDVRIYDRELTDYEVRTLARSLKTGSMGPVLPAESAVTVDAGATFRADGMHVVSNSVSGAGYVEIATGARFGAADWSGFTGRVTGPGELVVAKGASGPLSAQVSTAVSFEDRTLVFSRANTSTPLVRTTGRVILGETGTLALASGSGMLFGGKVFKIAECSSYIGPTDTAGWTFDPAEPNLQGKFVFKDGTLWLRMKGGSTMLLFR